MYLSSPKEDKKQIIESSSKSSFLEVSEVHTTSVHNEVRYFKGKVFYFLYIYSLWNLHLQAIIKSTQKISNNVKSDDEGFESLSSPTLFRGGRIDNLDRNLASFEDFEEKEKISFEITKEQKISKEQLLFDRQKSIEVSSKAIF